MPVLMDGAVRVRLLIRESQHSTTERMFEMRSSADAGNVDCRVVVLFRIASKELEALLPAGIRPREVGGRALAGIALIRRRLLRPPIVPERFAESNSVVHYINVVRERAGRFDAGVFVTRYDTSSRLRAWIGGGRGVRGWRSHHARFHVSESAETIEFIGNSDDRIMHLALRARVAQAVPATSVFRSPQQALEFQRRGLVHLGLLQPDLVHASESGFDDHLRFQPLAVERLESSVFEDKRGFARGTTEFDSAFWLQHDAFSWSGQNGPCCDVAIT